MDREQLLAILVLLLCGPATVAAGSWMRPTPTTRGSGRQLEAQAWRCVWRPLVPASLIAAALIGWAIAEPDDAEGVGFAPVLVAVGVGAFWLRAIVRGVRSMIRVAPSGLLAGTVGLLWPRIVIAPQLRGLLDDSTLRAIELHEQAHARHRDPLRLWLAQLVTDLQWPIPAAPTRLRDWLDALELARDEEAIRRGADEAALAHGIVTCAKLLVHGHDGPVAACLTREGELLHRRIRRLLDGPLGDEQLPERGRWVMMTLGLALLASAVLGAVFGEVVIRALTGALT